MVSCTDLTSPSPQPISTENQYIMTAPAISPALLFNNSKDSRWLTLEVCREFQRNRCTRTEEECKFAHPPPHVDQQNGRVMCCFDSIKGKCQRKEPPCKYLHPPQHLKEQLLSNGRLNLQNKYQWNQILAQNQIAAQLPAATHLMHGMGGIPGMPGIAGHLALDSNRYLSAAAAANAGVLHTGLANQPMITPSPYLYNQYPGIPTAAAPMTAPGMGQLPLQFAVSQGAPAAATAAAATLESQALAQIPSTSSASSTPSVNGQKTPRADRLEVCPEFSKEGTCPVPDSECDKAHPPDYVLTEDDLAVVCMDFVKGKCTREHCKYYHPTPKLLAKVNQNRAALAAVNQANTHAAQQALSQVLAAAALHQAPVQTPQPLLGLGQASTGSVPSVSAIPTAMPQVSQAASLNAYNMAAASYPYQNALGMHTGLAGPAGLAGAYQTGLATSVAAGQLTAAGSATGSLQAATAATHDAVLGQQQAKKRHRDDEQQQLLLPMQGVPGMGVPIKRQALDATKGAIPMFNPYQQLAYAQQQPAYVPVSSQMPSPTSYQLFSNGNTSSAGTSEQVNGTGNVPPRIQLLSNNVDNVNYYDDNSQLLDTLPVCRDYRSGQCNRPACKYIHLLEDHVEVSDGKVTVCRDNVKGKCLRSNCKYYHLPWYVLLRPTQNQ